MSPVFHCIVPCVSSSPGVNSVSKLSQTGKDDKVLSKKTKNPEVGKLTEADKASTGRVGKGLLNHIRAKNSSSHVCM